MEKEYAKAYKEFKLVLSYRDTEWADAARFHMGQCRFQQEDYNSALLEFSRVDIKSDYGDKAAYWSALSNLELKQFQEAINMFNLLLSKFPNTEFRPQALFRIATSHFELGEYSEVVKAVDKFLSEYPDVDLPSA